jgi:predicted nucleotidyltransferase component of viral defense system
MIPFDSVKKFFPAPIQDNALFAKHMMKEYVQLMVLDFLSASPYARKTAFIGGTSLRLVKGIDRFSEDLDFDCKDMSREEFKQMTYDVLAFLNRNGFNAEAHDSENAKLKAFRSSIYFPGLLFSLGLSRHKEERFLLKIECQDQKIAYATTTAFVKGCGYFFPITVPPDPVLCSMKLTAMLARSKGRDFYDVMFLLQQTPPDYGFLSKSCGIDDHSKLINAIAHLIERMDLTAKHRDCEHLLFVKENSRRILRFGDFIKTL